MQTPPDGDDLDRPLGVDRAPRGREREIPYVRLALLGVVALGISLGAFVYLTGDPDGGQPLAVAPIGAGQSAGVPATPAKVATAAPTGDGAGDTTGSVRKFAVGGNEIEDRNGVKVVSRQGAGGSGALIIEVPESLSVRLVPAPDKRVSQAYEHGVLPKIGDDGARPADIYARRVVLPKGLPAGAPRIAVLVGGLGPDRDGTARAIEKLPQEVTLAFGPSGTGLAAQAAAARDEGHEIMLQVPMEPSAAADGRTLVAAAPPSRNIDRLRWMMSRFPGYVGIANSRGDGFTGDAGAMRPLLREIGARGLIYADDGTSAQSVAKSAAAAAKVSFVATDVVLDASPLGADIDAALARLEAVAHSKGFAVGSAAAGPTTIDRIEAWARQLEAHGIALVPMSAAASRAATVSSLPSPDR